MPAKPHKGTRMKPNSIALLTLGVSLLALSANGQDRLTREEYIQKYTSLAVEEMEVYGIPASITMAQALARIGQRQRAARRAKANNHFGIKCKSTWTGATISHDDDAAGECFPQVRRPSRPRIDDHSEFLDRSGPLPGPVQAGPAGLQRVGLRAQAGRLCDQSPIRRAADQDHRGQPSVPA